MRTPLVAGNWKCHLRLDSARALAASLRQRLQGLDGVEVAVCPTFVHLLPVKEELAGSSIRLGAQDTHWQDDVAATGEVGPAMLAELVSYVIIGHSERRYQFGESDEAVRRKLEAALARGLLPILCVGETSQERVRGHTQAVLERQMRSALEGLGRCMAWWWPTSRCGPSAPGARPRRPTPRRPPAFCGRLWRAWPALARPNAYASSTAAA